MYAGHGLVSHQALSSVTFEELSSSDQSGVSSFCIVSCNPGIWGSYLAAGREHLQTSGVRCEQDQAGDWCIQRERRLWWHAWYLGYWVVMQPWQGHSELSQSQDGWHREWSGGNWAEHRNSNGLSQTMFCQPSLNCAAHNRSEGSAKSSTLLLHSMARLEVKSFVTKCLKPLSSIIGWSWKL